MNRLAQQTSPYLRQHADNPVDWYPWGEEAFALAAETDRPILLSVGYSACHWCHVMAHESFEDAEVAKIMNELFVNIKVDREERPDVDAVYMEATQAMTGSGGWPMTVFMTPTGEPFFCGTYFPKYGRHGQMGFVDLCRAVDQSWRDRRGDIDQQAARISEYLRDTSLPEHSGALDVGIAVERLLGQHDRANGGFGRAPKFPQTMSLELLLRRGGTDGLAAVTTSLDAMAAGGIYDHLGGGFARYSVDPVWLVPHFEKMLYDQALLARVYLHAWQVTGEPRFRQVLDETIGYVLRDLRDPDGGFWSAEDADSEGVEGKFYVWTPAQMRDVLVDGAATIAAMKYWGVTDGGNFEGSTILNRMHARGDLLRPDDIEAARQKLFDARATRIRPGLDDKVLTEWNGLMLATLAEAAAATANAEWLAAAVQTGEFLLANLRRGDGRWLRAANTTIPAFAADHGALVDAFTRLAEATGEARWIGHACSTADALLELFWDDHEGGVFTTGHDAEALIARQKDLLDNATPSANSLAAVGLLRLAALTGNEAYRERGEAIVRLQPAVTGATDLVASGITEIVIPGASPELVRPVQSRYLPNAVLAWGEAYDSPLWEGRVEGQAYVCRNYTCQSPVSTPEALAALL